MATDQVQQQSGVHAASEVVGRRIGASLVDGAPAGAGRVAVRTVLRIIDVLPVLYLVGFIAMMATPSRRRLGDLAAGTNVVST